jgi:hypothetical protein
MVNLGWIPKPPKNGDLASLVGEKKPVGLLLLKNWLAGCDLAGLLFLIVRVFMAEYFTISYKITVDSVNSFSLF